MTNQEPIGEAFDTGREIVIAVAVGYDLDESHNCDQMRRWAERTEQWRDTNNRSQIDYAVESIRAGRYDGAHMKCFNKTEADGLRAYVKSKYPGARFTFSYLFDNHAAPSSPPSKAEGET